ncbi:hypothetical protein BHQ23_27320 [Mycobacterium gordonae]|uniref:Uncharacterized protein n=1 Tax=Mycobacterium gordonae TaxID=1778 RepID=A0A1X1VL64_MYCGO|nr:hypothetical protein BHQ23_27320 [Mycobacterium gordonae]ORV69862.1 hypothetical protein AWC08_06025 [Mycobacterium gordonae]
MCDIESTPTVRKPAVRCACIHYRKRTARRIEDAVICAQCARTAKTAGQWQQRTSTGRVVLTHPDGPLDVGRCEACGLCVALRADPRRERFVCSNACRQQTYYRAAEKTKATCDECGSTFTARRGARYCSSPCRQRAYRARNREV